jgi:hypothetical protein
VATLVRPPVADKGHDGRSAPDTLPTPHSTLRARYVRVLVWCKACRHQADADLQALVGAPHGDVPLTRLRFRCTSCDSWLTDFVLTSDQRTIRSRGNGERFLKAGPNPTID